MKMLHVTIQTEKFEAEVQFYLNIVGLKMITDMRPMGMQMVFLADNEGDTEIEIIENPEAKPIETEFLSVGFKTDVLMNALFGKTTNSTGGILMSIREKFWIGVLIHTTISWCLVFYLIWVIY